MSLIKPFLALMPPAAKAQQVAAPPYDVLSSDEARQMAAGNPDSFLHISKPEIDLPPDTAPYAAEVYARAKSNMADFLARGTLGRRDRPAYYIYQIDKKGHRQTGIAAAASVMAYREGRIRRHEFTRPDKETDRVRQIEAVGAHTGLVMTAHPTDDDLAAHLESWAKAHKPALVVDLPDGSRHSITIIEEPDDCRTITEIFDSFSHIYIADGHHRSAAAARVSRDTGGRFLIVSFPCDEMRILDYNRTVRDLGGLSADIFLAGVKKAYRIDALKGEEPPRRKGDVAMYLDGIWYRLRLPADARPDDPVNGLDVSLLTTRILSPVLGIQDMRADPRIDFVGGSRGLHTLSARVDSGAAAVAFALFPTAMAELTAVADAGMIMPPKSTWFDPKLADGLVALPL